MTTTSSDLFSRGRPRDERGWGRGWGRAALFPLAAALPMGLLQTLFFLFPLLFLTILSLWEVRNFRVVPGFSLANWQAVLGEPYFWAAYGRTLGLAAGAAALASVVAFPCAYAITFVLRAEARRLVTLLLVIPFFTSYLVRVYSWQVFLNDRGVINTLLGHLGIGPLPLLNSVAGTMVGWLTLVLPLVILLQVVGLGAVDRKLVHAAHNLGCRAGRAVFLVVIPAARPALVIGALFAFVLAFGDFVSPLYLGGGKAPTLSILIADTTKAGQQWPRAAVIAVMMIATLLLAAFTAVTLAYRGRK